MFLISVTSDERLFQRDLLADGESGIYGFAIPGRHISLPSPWSGVLFSLAKDLNLMALGEETASELGVEVERVKKIAFVFASLITGAVVSVSGLIGFVGLVVPHLVRMLWGPDHRFLLPASALAGAILLVSGRSAGPDPSGPFRNPGGASITALGGLHFLYIFCGEKALPAILSAKSVSFRYPGSGGFPRSGPVSGRRGDLGPDRPEQLRQDNFTEDPGRNFEGNSGDGLTGGKGYRRVFPAPRLPGKLPWSLKRWKFLFLLRWEKSC